MRDLLTTGSSGSGKWATLCGGYIIHITQGLLCARFAGIATSQEITLEFWLGMKFTGREKTANKKGC